MDSAPRSTEDTLHRSLTTRAIDGNARPRNRVCCNGGAASSSIYGEQWMLVATTVSLALVGIVLWGTLVGSLLPFGLRRLGFDPATSSAPFVAMLVVSRVW